MDPISSALSHVNPFSAPTCSGRWGEVYSKFPGSWLWMNQWTTWNERCPKRTCIFPQVFPLFQYTEQVTFLNIPINNWHLTSFLPLWCFCLISATEPGTCGLKLLKLWAEINVCPSKLLFKNMWWQQWQNTHWHISVCRSELFYSENEESVSA